MIRNLLLICTISAGLSAAPAFAVEEAAPLAAGGPAAASYFAGTGSWLAVNAIPIVAVVGVIAVTAVIVGDDDNTSNSTATSTN